MGPSASVTSVRVRLVELSAGLMFMEGFAGSFMGFCVFICERSVKGLFVVEVAFGDDLISDKAVSVFFMGAALDGSAVELEPEPEPEPDSFSKRRLRI